MTEEKLPIFDRVVFGLIPGVAVIKVEGRNASVGAGWFGL